MGEMYIEALKIRKNLSSRFFDITVFHDHYYYQGNWTYTHCMFPSIPDCKSINFNEVI